jgi:hypothetical protein
VPLLVVHAKAQLLGETRKQRRCQLAMVHLQYCPGLVTYRCKTPEQAGRAFRCPDSLRSSTRTDDSSAHWRSQRIRVVKRPVPCQSSKERTSASSQSNGAARRNQCKVGRASHPVPHPEDHSSLRSLNQYCYQCCGASPKAGINACRPSRNAWCLPE